MNARISVIIPNYNGSATARTCLESVFKSNYTDFEVIVVDDHSSDDSLTIIGMYPCRIVRLYTHFGAAFARNMGAKASHGEILFFTDIDCVLAEDTLSIVARHFPEDVNHIPSSHLVIGGTYSSHAYDKKFFSQFQSIFIRYSELKYLHTPDYISSHAMALPRKLFQRYTGFNNNLMLMEDVEFSHRLRSHGMHLVMDPKLEVQHIFNFSLWGSLRNALRKSKYWTSYSLAHHDLLTDSGTASIELKINSLAFLVSLFVIMTSIMTNQVLVLGALAIVLAINGMINYRFIVSTYRAHGIWFLIPALFYYFYMFPIAVLLGGVMGMTSFIVKPIIGRS